MKKVLVLAAAIAFVVLGATAFATTYGKAPGAGDPVKLSELLASPEQYVGKIVKVEGVITDVCAKRGCWMAIAGDKEFQSIRFKVEDGVIVIPLEAKGKQAVAEGTFTKVEMTKEQAIEAAKHHAEEQKQPFDPASVTGPTVTYQLMGTGAIIE
ncbi:MAG: DUF4920 domain-containing protein [Acidobacteria bacterium]|nr:DUF4920 domain-containing protein [Acidobacteriota bacterium]